MSSSSGKKPLPERRRYPHLDAAAHVQYTPSDKRARSNRRVTKDISAGGICLVTYEALKVNTVLTLSVQLPDVNEGISAEGRVVWVKEFSIGSEARKCYEVGIEFVKIDEYAQHLISQYVFKALKTDT